MSTICLSPAFITAALPRVFRGSGSTAGDSGIFSPDVSSKCFIHIMPGIMPTNLTYSTFTTTNAIALCSFSAADLNRSVFNTNLINIITEYVAATITGTATWFLITVISNPYIGYGNYALQINSPSIHQLAGTIGLVGSGADLELPSTTITVGQLLRIANLHMALPTSFTY